MFSLPLSCFSYQWGHREADDLNAAVIMALRLEVSMVAGVSPRHGASTVPAQVWNISNISNPLLSEATYTSCHRSMMRCCWYERKTRRWTRKVDSLSVKNIKSLKRAHSKELVRFTREWKCLTLSLFKFLCKQNRNCIVAVTKKRVNKVTGDTCVSELYNSLQGFQWVTRSFDVFDDVCPLI